MREIAGCEDRLLELAKTQPEKRKEVTAPADHPFRETFSWKQCSRTSLVRQPVEPFEDILT